MRPPHSTDADASSLAAILDAAHLDGRLLRADQVVLADVTTAYDVQDALTALREARGQVRVGHKLGYTSEAMRQQMGVADPNHGPILSSMVVGAEPLALTQPRVEPEIALVIGEALRGIVSVPEVLAACREARCALEVVDSVWVDYRFDLEHNTADGSSAAGLVLGPAFGLDHLEEVEVDLCVGGVVVGRGRGSDALGHPAAAVAWLVAALTARGDLLQPGDVVITGGLTAAHAAQVTHAPGQVAPASTRIRAIFHTAEGDLEVTAPDWLRG